MEPLPIISFGVNPRPDFSKIKKFTWELLKPILEIRKPLFLLN